MVEDGNSRELYDADDPDAEPDAYDDGTGEPVGERSADPDVLLDVPQLSVDEITLDVEDLRARVSLRAEVLDLLKLSVGADVSLGSVHLDIKGVEAQALLKVRLDQVVAVVGRVLTTIDRNPQILEQITSGLGAGAEDLASDAGRAVGELGRGAGEAVEDVGRGAGEAVEDVGEHAGEAVEGVGRGAGEAVAEEVGGRAGKAAEGAGGAVDGAARTAEAAGGLGGKTRGKSARAAKKSAGRAGSAGRTRERMARGRDDDTAPRRPRRRREGGESDGHPP
ncbi:hypothetical protein [Streptomyces meridianus]|uniref:Uncharacterized protein n=1 Tax=Streptomyces meridianus TaxID=2938945 RepID=A0ABT0X9G3_9ACTN|nr:hypothetical protein [Streptomyces meridianus]MCM2579174.1 hypothetical protein [Streptomyces meridianus]